jgi:hypothetical protein
MVKCIFSVICCLFLAEYASAQTFYPVAGSKIILGGGTSGTTQLLLKAPSSAFTPYTITFPATTPTNTFILQTDGSGQLSWINPTSFGFLTGLTVDAPLTGSGTSGSHLTFSSQADNLVFASPDGATGAPSFRALASADIPNLNTSKLTAGILPIARGGTGVSTYTLGDLLYYSSGTTLTQLNGNTTTTRQFLSQTGNGTISAAPAWNALASTDIPSLDAAKITTGIFPIARGGTGLSSYTLGGILYYSSGTTLTQLNGNTTTTRQFLSQTGNGTVSAAPVWNALAASDIPNLDASKVTSGVFDVADGGTGASTLTDHGVLIGSGTGPVSVTSTGNAGQILESGGSSADPSFASAALAVYGDGSDGALTYDGTTTILGMAPAANVYTLTRDIFLSSMTVNNGVTIKASGARIYCTGTITNNGTIQNNGNNASTNTAGAATIATNILGIGQAGGAGGSSGAGGATVATANAGGGAGGVGGISGAGQAAGTVAGIVAPLAANGGAAVFRSFNCANTGLILMTTVAKVTGGSGGSGGGGSGANNGGGGGSGGGVLLINSWKIDNTNGTISANGGNGGNGTGANGGSGGGGGGGLVLLIYHSYVSNAATATGGAAGTVKTGTGVLGSAGNAGKVVTLQN